MDVEKFYFGNNLMVKTDKNKIDFFLLKNNDIENIFPFIRQEVFLQLLKGFMCFLYKVLLNFKLLYYLWV